MKLINFLNEYEISGGRVVSHSLEEDYFQIEGCHYFALALNELYNYPIFIISDDDNPYIDTDNLYRPDVSHVFVQNPRTKKYLDSKGQKTIEEIKRNFPTESTRIIEVTRKELMKEYMGDDDSYPLYGYDKTAVQEAKNIIKQKPDVYK